MAHLNQLKQRNPGFIGAALRTHEGAPAAPIDAEAQLRRSVLACLLWEDQFYENGIAIADRIAGLVPRVEAARVAALAVEAREQMKLRHVPLLLVREAARFATHRGIVAETLARVIQRADELAEFLAIYWKDGRQPLSAQVKKGLAAAFCKFDEYALAKYNRDGRGEAPRCAVSDACKAGDGGAGIDVATADRRDAAFSGDVGGAALARRAEARGVGVVADREPAGSAGAAAQPAEYAGCGR